MVPVRFLGSVLVAAASAWFAASAVAADDHAQVQICKRLLDAMASGNPEQATDIMLREGQPGGVQVSKEGEANLGKMRTVMRRTYDGLIQRNGGKPQAREPMPERKLGARVAVMERWDFANGSKAYAGCVRFPDKTSVSNKSTWATNLQFGPDESSVTSKLQHAAAAH